MLRISFMALVVLFSSQVMATKIYKWVDEKGQIHYSSTKPANQQVETVKVRKGPKVEPKPVAAEAETMAVADVEGQEAEQLDPAVEAAAREQLAAADRLNRKKACDLARENYNALNSSTRVSQVNAQGESVRMTDDQRVKALATAQQGIAQNCN